MRFGIEDSGTPARKVEASARGRLTPRPPSFCQCATRAVFIPGANPSQAGTNPEGHLFRIAGNPRSVVITLIPKFLLVALFLSAAVVGRAEEPGKVDLEAAEMVAELIGAPVLANDGTEVGEVADILFDDELQPQRLRMTTAAILGFGVRTLEIPKGAFMPVRGAVMLRVPAEAVSAFSELAEPTGEK
jgi:sporulation protein YlmC with PRC-barrel domain